MGLLVVIGPLGCKVVAHRERVVVAHPGVVVHVGAAVQTADRRNAGRRRRDWP